MTNSANLQRAFELAVEQYESLGVNVQRALERLRDVAISVHCWQGDDFGGFEGNSGALGNGLAVTEWLEKVREYESDVLSQRANESAAI